MKFKKRIAILVIIAILTITAIGCENDKQHVAEVNGEKILRSEVQEIYDQELAYYQVVEAEATDEMKEQLEALKLEILDNLIYQKLINQKALEAGFTITDDIMAEANSEFDMIVENYINNLKLEDERNNIDTADKDYVAIAEELIDNELDQVNSSKEEFKDTLSNNIMLEKYLNDLTKDLSVSDEDIQSYYDTAVQNQKDFPEQIANEPVKLYEPNKVRLKYLLLELSQEHSDEYDALKSEEKDEEAEEYLDEQMKLLGDTANEVYNDINSEEDFMRYAEIHTADIWVDENEDGFWLSNTGTFGIPEFEDAVFNLDIGAVSEPIETSLGYYIAKVYEKEADMTYPLDEKKDEIQEYLINQMRISEINKTIDDWMENENIKKYPERL